MNQPPRSNIDGGHAEPDAAAGPDVQMRFGFGHTDWRHHFLVNDVIDVGGGELRVTGAHRLAAAQRREDWASVPVRFWMGLGALVLLVIRVWLA